MELYCLLKEFNVKNESVFLKIVVISNIVLEVAVITEILDVDVMTSFNIRFLEQEL